MANLVDAIHSIVALIQARRLISMFHQWQQYAEEIRFHHCGISLCGYHPVHIDATSVRR